MDSLPGCTSVGLTEGLSTLSWSTRRSNTRVSIVQSIGHIGQSAIQIQGLEDIYKTVQSISLEACPYNDIERQALVGEGETFLVERCSVKAQLVAVKHLKLGTLAADTPKFFSRLKAVILELHIMRHDNLTRHPNILSLLAYGWRHEENAILPYILVDYSPHGTLRDFLLHNPLVKAYQKKRLIMDVGAGLDALHLSGIIHGDVKLDNVLVFNRTGDPQAGRLAKICDFGHSLLLSGEEQDLQYRGTALYNAPEVRAQSATPIKKALLHKCDVWAFGLLAWEVLLNGDLYINYITKDVHLHNAGDNYEEHHSQELLDAAIFSARSVLDRFQKLFFHGIFRMTLQVMPHSRTSYLTANLPVVKTLDLSSDFPTHVLSPPPPLDMGKSEWTFEMFRPEQANKFSWEHQKQIVQAFERYYKKYQKITDLAGSAAWQTGLCYLLGFGVPVDAEAALLHLRKAEQHGHAVAKIFGPLIQDTSECDNRQALYSTAIVHGLISKPRTSRNCTFLVNYRGAPVTHFDDYNSLVEWIDGWIRDSPDDQEMQGEGLGASAAPETFSGDLTACEVTIANSNTGSMNLLECAISFRNRDLLRRLCSWRSTGWAASTVSPEPLLVQACRTGDAHMVESLLIMGADPHQQTPDGCTMLHWLFMVGEHALLLNKRFLLSKSPQTSINLPCTTIRHLHVQWPLQLTGTPLSFAVSAGSVAGVIALLELGADAAAPAYARYPNNASDWSGWTPLHLAAKCHHVEILKLLLATVPKVWNTSPLRASVACALSYSSPIERIALHGHNRQHALNQTIATLGKLRSSMTGSQHERTPLIQAIDFRDEAVVRALLQHDRKLARRRPTDPHQKSEFDYPAHLAVQVATRRETPDTFAILDLLLTYNKNSLSAVNESGWSPLHVAVMGFSARVTEWVLKRQPSLLGVIDDRGRSALHYCSSADNVKLLLSYGADIDHTDELGMSSLHCACQVGAAQVIQALICGQADVNLKDNARSTPLHYAVSKGSWEAVKVLLAFEARVDEQDQEGETPMHLAVRQHREDLVRPLLDHGASALFQNSKGQTPLHIAILSENSHALKILYGRSSLSAVQDKDGNTPMHLCALSGRAEWMALLLETSYSSQTIAVVNNAGQIPLHLAATSSGLETARLLLQMGSPVNSKDVKGDTPLHIAIKCSAQDTSTRPEFCELLHSWGASLTQRDGDGQTPWDFAVQTKNGAVMSFLANLGGVDACPGLVFADGLLQVAIGEKDPSRMIALYKDGSAHAVEPSSLNLLRHAVKAHAEIVQSLLSSGFQDHDKEIIAGFQLPEPSFGYTSQAETQHVAEMSYHARYELPVNPVELSTGPARSIQSGIFELPGDCEIHELSAEPVSRSTGKLLVSEVKAFYPELFEFFFQEKIFRYPITVGEPSVVEVLPDA